MKKEPWRIAVSILSILWIVWMWIDKDVAAIYTSMPAEQAIPMIATTVAVALAKIGLIAAVVFLGKWILEKRKK